MPPTDPSSTITQIRTDTILVPNLRVRVVQANAEERVAPLGLPPIRVGTGAECDMIVKDSKVSRVHLEVRLTPRGILLRDLQSKNGISVGPIEIVECYLQLGIWITMGDCRLAVELAGTPNEVTLSPSHRFGSVLGKSLVMRSLFNRLEHAARYNSPILLTGEQGSGKRTLAEAVHRASPWAAGPWIMLDTRIVPRDALEIALFGCAPGIRAEMPDGCAGALEQSHNGTLYLVEPAEIPFLLQKRLVAALAARTCYRVGGVMGIPFETRLITGTEASLGPAVASGVLDEELQRWLSVVPFDLPPLRDRREDIALLVEHFLSARTPPLTIADLPAEAMEFFEGHTWPRNVRQLKSFVERLALYPEISREVLVSLLGEQPRASDDRSIRPLLKLSFEEARELVEERFTKLYLTAQLERHGGNVSQAARGIGVHRVHLHRLLRRYGIRRDND